MAYMQFDGDLRDIERSCDFLISEPPRNHAEHFHFSTRERTMRNTFGQDGSHTRLDIATAGMYLADGSQQFFSQDVFQNIAACPGLQGAIDFFLPAVCGQYEDRCLGEILQDRGSTFGSVHSR